MSITTYCMTGGEEFANYTVAKAREKEQNRLSESKLPCQPA